MKTAQIEQRLTNERKVLTDQLEAIDLALAGLKAYRNAGADGGQKVKAPTKPKSKTPAKGKSQGKRPTQPKIECPDCGKLYHKGPGMSQHRASNHGWTKESGIDVNTEPMPGGIPNG